MIEEDIWTINLFTSPFLYNVAFVVYTSTKLLALSPAKWIGRYSLLLILQSETWHNTHEKNLYDHFSLYSTVSETFAIDFLKSKCEMAYFDPIICIKSSLENTLTFQYCSNLLCSLIAADEAQWDSFIFPWWKLFIDWPYFGNKTSRGITDIM